MTNVRTSMAERPARFRRIRLFAALAMIVATLSGTVAAAPPAAAATANANSNLDLANVELPGDLGQTSSQVWVPETEHSIRGYMLDYWRANGAASIYGFPISEPFASVNNRYSQAFEGGVFEFYPELVWTDLPSISLMPVSQEILDDRLGDFRRDGRRDGGGGDRRASAWSDVSPESGTVQRALEEGGMHSEFSGQTLRGAFLGWYSSHEGEYYLGNPISQPVEERGGVVQYFEGGALFRDANGGVSVLPIVRENARMLGIETTNVARDGLPIYDERYFWEADNPNPLGDPYAKGRKWIEIDISEQTLYAYQGETLITSSLISTGLSPNDTEIGVFHVRYKLEEQDMAGATGPNGEVIAMGQDAAEDAQASGQGSYVVEDVPHVMYINMDAEALHGAYWHNNFGQRMSHGCINQPLEFAEFLYGWAPLGTMVWVHN